MTDYFSEEALTQSVCIQSDDTDGTTANEDEALRQQPNNTRASVPGTLGAGSKQSPREITLSSKARYRTVKRLFLKTLYLTLKLHHISPTLFFWQRKAVWGEATSAEAGAEDASWRASEAHWNPRQDSGLAVGLPWPSGTWLILIHIHAAICRTGGKENSLSV